ncbi:Rieske 2Fe-2S domain-containing protein [Aeromicrobium sp. YIM 150415]|uniref:Rieske (2Fe-2S) protein n=1 Tax=Aeromicrobium sp. YIM 150415 TaxID=2803912 RepID=UPI0019668B30|nr:Rieske 2Fe-2S domain-containing protein [Aeromicrobium sp. YIM 150415]MBM9463588.1 Rieske 2Fe-2S domain-containing protein [Aeromicrobium sp. YIM 150415]
MSASVTAVAVGDSEDVPERGRLVVDIGDRTVGVFRVAGQLRAYENTCPHMGGPVCQGLIIPGVRENLDEGGMTVGQEFDEEDLRIVCPWHGFEFSIDTGRHAGAGRPRLRSFPVDERDGVIYVEI